MSAVQNEIIDDTVRAIAAEKFPPRIRPNYYRDAFVGFRIEVFNVNRMGYERIGFNFETYKLAMLSLRAIETGNEPREGCVTPATDRHLLNRARPPINKTFAFGFWLYVLAIVAAILLMSGCSANGEWTQTDTRREVVYQLANAVDAYQTNKYRDLPTIEEGMPVTRAFIGAEPSGRSVATYFASLALSHYLISAALPAKWRPWFQNGTAVGTAYVVYSNCQKHDALCE